MSNANPNLAAWPPRPAQPGKKQLPALSATGSRLVTPQLWSVIPCSKSQDPNTNPFVSLRRRRHIHRATSSPFQQRPQEKEVPESGMGGRREEKSLKEPKPPASWVFGRQDFLLHTHKPIKCLLAPHLKQTTHSNSSPPPGLLCSVLIDNGGWG